MAAAVAEVKGDTSSSETTDNVPDGESICSNNKAVSAEVDVSIVSVVAGATADAAATTAAATATGLDKSDTHSVCSRSGSFQSELGYNTDSEGEDKQDYVFALISSPNFSLFGAFES